LQIIKGKVFVNGKPQKEIPGIQYDYAVVTNGRRLNVKKLQQLGISKEDIQYGSGFIHMPLTKNMVEELNDNKFVQKINPLFREKDYYDNKMFPHDDRYKWNLDYYGPIYIPKKGKTIKITLDNLPFYERIIDYYEQNDLNIMDSTIYINGKPAGSYTFKMDYYWMMGDNRHKSLDSRYWGYVPEDHVIGAPKFIWLSLNRDKSFPANIRLRRMFKRIR
jgi:signal peptidase I